MYAGSFDAAIQEQRAVIDLNPAFVQGYAGLALALLAAGKRDEAVAAWRSLEALGGAGASAAVEGLADLAVFEGRLSDARELLERGIAADRATKDEEASARKLAMIAEVHLAAGREPEARAAAEEAARAASSDWVIASAASTLAAAGAEARALALAGELSSRLGPEPRMYAALVRGEVEMRRKAWPAAVGRFQEAVQLIDGWLARYALGHAYLAAGAYPEAQDQLERCVRRRGEATDVPLDIAPTFRLYPLAEYDLGLVDEALHSASAAERFRSFLAVKTGDEDALVRDARRHLAVR
jgi:tetratricopeptide (TPR) repeat protein